MKELMPTKKLIYVNGHFYNPETKVRIELKDDIEVKFLCTVDFYPPYGRIRLVVENIDPFYTIGKLAQEKQKLIATLRRTSEEPLSEADEVAALRGLQEQARHGDLRRA